MKQYFFEPGAIRCYRKRGISVISVVIDAPQDVISSISGRIGKLPGINTKTTYSNIIAKNEDA